MSRLDIRDNTKSQGLFQVFLSYSRIDKEKVRSLYQKLRNDGFNIWFDEESLLPGQKWEDVIDNAIRTVSAVVICLSENSIDKAGYVQKEIKLALEVADKQPEGKIFIIPVKLEECRVPERLRSVQWANLFDTNGYERLHKVLLQLRSDQTERNSELTSLESTTFPEITIIHFWV